MENETKWFNQTLLTFKDETYSNSYLRLTIASSTNDYLLFNPPFLSLSISNQYSKNIMIKIHEAEDLVTSITEALEKNISELNKRYQKNISLVISFFVEDSTKLVKLQLISSPTDATEIILPFPFFMSFTKRIKHFIEKYDELCYNLLLRTTKQEYYDLIKQLPSLIKNLPAQIISEPNEEKNQDNLPVREFENFIDSKISEIEIDVPNLDLKSTVAHESLLFNFFEKDLTNIETKTSAYSVSHPSIIVALNELSEFVGADFFNKVSDDERASLVYLSELFKEVYLKDYILNEKPIPSRIPILCLEKYSQDQTFNDISKDLLVIISFLRQLSQRLSAKSANSSENRSMLYMYTRCFYDPLCFSYISSMTRDELVGTVKNHFQSLKEKGFFKSYDQLLLDFGCEKIEEKDVLSFCDSISNLLSNNLPSVCQLHQKLYSTNVVKLPPTNKLKEEQIINEFVPLEVLEKIGTDLKNEDNISKIKEQHNISEEIINLYLGLKKPSIIKEKRTPLQDWINRYQQDVPEKYRETTIDLAKQLQDKKFDFSKTELPLQEFDENIVKALYIWDPVNDPQMKIDRNYFSSLVVNEILTKDDILRITTENRVETNGWDILNQDIV